MKKILFFRKRAVGRDHLSFELTLITSTQYLDTVPHTTRSIDQSTNIWLKIQSIRSFSRRQTVSSKLHTFVKVYFFSSVRKFLIKVNIRFWTFQDNEGKNLGKKI